MYTFFKIKKRARAKKSGYTFLRFVNILFLQFEKRDKQNNRAILFFIFQKQAKQKNCGRFFLRFVSILFLIIEKGDNKKKICQDLLRFRSILFFNI